MSQKPPVPPQECDQHSVLGQPRRPRPALKRKPDTEVVVQLGPFTDGQITAPEMVRPLEGPTEWLIKPKTGEIVPHDAGAPPEKGVIRKYISVGAQDSDVPDDLPNISQGFVVDRSNPATLPTVDERGNGQTNTLVSYVQDRYDSGTLTCEKPPTTPVDENETPPTSTPPVDEEETDTCKPCCPSKDCDTPVNEEETPPACQPVDAIDDCVSTEKDCPITIDALKNDKGQGQLSLHSADAEHGYVEIKNGHLVYTPKDGFTGQDVITYTIKNECGMEDTAHVYVTVEAATTPGKDISPQPSDTPLEYCPEPVGKVHDHEYSSSPVDESLQAHWDHAEQIINNISDRMDHLLAQKSSGWSQAWHQASLETPSAMSAVEDSLAA